MIHAKDVQKLWHVAQERTCFCLHPFPCPCRPCRPYLSRPRNQSARSRLSRLESLSEYNGVSILRWTLCIWINSLVSEGHISVISAEVRSTKIEGEAAHTAHPTHPAHATHALAQLNAVLVASCSYEVTQATANTRYCYQLPWLSQKELVKLKPRPPPPPPFLPECSIAKQRQAVRGLATFKSSDLV